ncbi:MAG: hypothetical protein R2857_09765 [Vampirovibrionales bacterium]
MTCSFVPFARPTTPIACPTGTTWVRDVLQPDKWNLNLMRRSVQMSDHAMASLDRSDA